MCMSRASTPEMNNVYFVPCRYVYMIVSSGMMVFGVIRNIYNIFCNSEKSNAPNLCRDLIFPAKYFLYFVVSISFFRKLCCTLLGSGIVLIGVVRFLFFDGMSSRSMTHA